MGFQKFTTPDASYRMTAPTFVNLSDAAIPLKEFVVKSLDDSTFRQSNFNIIFFGENGNPMLVKNDTTMRDTEEFQAAYAAFGKPESTTELTFGIRSGHWYLVDDSSRDYQMDNYPVAPGRGFNIHNAGHSAGVELTFAGAVANEDYKVTVPDSTYALSGNSMPVDVALKDLTVESIDSSTFRQSNFNLIFFGSNGNPMKVKDDDQMRDTEEFQAAYAAFGKPESTTELTFGIRSGHWYLVDDSSRDYMMDDYVIKAGRGFNIHNAGHSAGVRVTVPSPILDQNAAE